MQTYQHTQPGTITRWLLGVSILFCVTALLTSNASLGEAFLSLIVLAVVLVVVLALFHNLTITVSDQQIEFSFGIGLIRKRISVGQVQHARAIKTRWYYGWGIHHTGQGWLYNVSGFEAVELHLHNGRQVQIGTDEPRQLLQAIETVVQHK